MEIFASIQPLVPEVYLNEWKNKSKDKETRLSIFSSFQLRKCFALKFFCLLHKKISMSSSGYHPPQLSQPAWLRNEGGGQEDVQPLNSNVSDAQLTPEMIQKARMLHSILRICTIGLCILMAFTAVIGIGMKFEMISRSILISISFLL